MSALCLVRCKAALPLCSRRYSKSVISPKMSSSAVYYWQPTRRAWNFARHLLREKRLAALFLSLLVSIVPFPLVGTSITPCRWRSAHCRTSPFLASTAFSVGVNSSLCRPPDIPGVILQPSGPRAVFYKGALVFPVGIDGWKMLVAATDGRTTPRVDLLAQTQGVYRQNTYVLAYDAVKKRDFQLTFSGRFDATYERVDFIVL